MPTTAALGKDHAAGASMLRDIRVAILTDPGMQKSPHPPLSVRSEAVLLVIATEDGPHTCASLAARLQMPKPSVVRAVDALEISGLAGRVARPADRRQPIYALKPAGIALVMRWAESVAQVSAALTKPAAA